MTTIIDSDRTGPDPQIPGTTPDEDFLIKAGVVVRSTGSTGAMLKGGGHDLTVEGTLEAKNYGAVLGDAISAHHNNTLTVAAGGLVRGGVLAVATWGSADVTNDGMILGGSIGLRLNMSGTTLSSVVNRGTIQGSEWGIDTSASGSAAMGVENFGTVKGVAYSLVDRGGGVNHILNRGTFDGIVSLGGGADRFDNVGGLIEGKVLCGTGNDVVLPGATAETFDAGGDIDTLDFRSGGGLRVSLADGMGTGRAQGDRYIGFEQVLGSQTGADELIGDVWANVLWGFGGNDELLGAAGDDRLLGGAGSDIMFGGAGADRLEAGAGADRLNGGLGKDQLYGGVDATGDRFVFAAPSHSKVGLNRDVVHNFSRGADHIDLRVMDANPATAGMNETFDWSGKTRDAHSVWWAASSQGVLLRGDVNGDRTADFEILLKGVASLGAWDVLL